MIGWLGGLQSSRQPNSCAAKRDPCLVLRHFPVWWVYDGLLLPADLVTRFACHQPGSGGCGSKKPALFSSNLSSLCSRGKKPVCWSGAGLGPGPGCPGKKRPDPSRCQSLAGQRGQAPVFSWAGAGRPAKTRGRAAAGHIPPPSPPHQGGYDGSERQSCKCNYVDFSKWALPPCWLFQVSPAPMLTASSAVIGLAG